MPRIDDHLMETSMLFVVNGCLPPPAVQTFGWDAPDAPTIKNQLETESYPNVTAIN
jgi:hypothetical protein